MSSPSANKKAQSKGYTLQMYDSFFSDLDRSPKKVKNAYHKTIAKRLRMNPTDTGTDIIKRLKHFKHYWRYRVGSDWRLVYEVDEGNRIVILMMIDLRDRIYKRMGHTPDGLTTEVIADPNMAPKLEADVTPEARGKALVKLESEDAPGKPEGDSGSSLPEPVTLELLRQLNVPEEWHPRLVQVRTEGDLMGCIGHVPGQWVDAIMQYFWPPAIGELIAEPIRVIEESDDKRIGTGDVTLESLLLKLDDNQKGFVSQFEGALPTGPWILKGGPGSGKSTIALHCIRGLLKQGADSLPMPGTSIRILFTTFTHSLVASADHLISALGRDNSQHELVTINVDALAREHAPESWQKLRYLKDKSDVEEQLVRQAIGASRREEKGFSFTLDDIRFLLDEIDWVILGENLTSEGQYLQADRAGRGRRLGKVQRHYVWLFWQKFLQELRENRRYMLTQRMLGALANIEPEFDYVFIDEAQDLKPAAIKLCLGLAKDPRNVFLTADTNQTIYGAGIAWSKMSDALDFRGRSRILRRNYRTSREIWEAIKPIAEGLSDIDQETLDSEPVFPGDIPMLAEYTTPDDEIDVLNKWLTEALLKERLAPSHAAVLCATNRDCARIARDLDKRLHARQLKSKEMDLGHPGVKVMTMHAAKGLQFPVVAVTGLRESRFPWKPDKGMDEQEHLDKNQRLFFVACSRAMRRLLVCSHKEFPSPFMKLFDEDLWEEFDN
jgi:superfamily I DNA/RNA helicase/mRNA-degrading endonuclease RelE of RelBE toxin-antitoxin system